METLRFCPICGKELNENLFCSDPECKFFTIGRFLQAKKDIEKVWETQPIPEENRMEMSKYFGATIRYTPHGIVNVGV